MYIGQRLDFCRTMRNIRASMWFSLLGIFSVVPSTVMGSTETPTEDTTTTPEAPQFKISKTLLQAQQYTLQALADLRLVILNEEGTGTHNPDLLPSQVALGFMEEDLQEGTLRQRLEKNAADETGVEHAMQLLASRFSERLSLHRADINKIVSTFNVVMNLIKRCQAMAMAHGTALLEYFDPEEYTTDDTRKQVLLEKAEELREYIKSVLFELPYDVDELEKKDITFYFPEAKAEDICDNCGTVHEAGTLCSQLTVSVEQENYNLAEADQLPYLCLCGQKHNATAECQNEPPFPVYMILAAEEIEEQTQSIISKLSISTFSATNAIAASETEQDEEEQSKIAGYVCKDGFWHAKSTFCEHESGIAYYCRCGKWHTATSQCEEKILVKHNGEEGHTEGDGQWLGVGSVNSDSSENGYPCKCGQWHTATIQCPNRYLVKKDGVDGYTVGAGKWLAVNTLDLDHISEGYPCGCGQWHTVTNACHANYTDGAYHPIPVSVNGQPGYVCSCGEWHETCTPCSSENGSCPYLCKCGKMHYKTMDCINMINMKTEKPYPVYKDGVMGYVCVKYHWHACNTQCKYGNTYGDLYLCECGYMHPKKSYCTESKDVTVLDY